MAKAPLYFLLIVYNPAIKKNLILKIQVIISLMNYLFFYIQLLRNIYITTLRIVPISTTPPTTWLVNSSLKPLRLEILYKISPFALSSKTLSIIALILSLINFLFLFSTRKIMYDTVNRELQEQSLIYSVETEALNTISSIKISGLEDEIYENWSKYLKNVLTKYKKRSVE